jgi:chitinase
MSATSGILEHYEIKSLLDQHPDLNPIYDRKAAIEYVVYNNDRWVSYNDADIFQQKVG